MLTLKYANLKIKELKIFKIFFISMQSPWDIKKNYEGIKNFTN
jgi:hypothetical protein